MGTPSAVSSGVTPPGWQSFAWPMSNQMASSGIYHYPTHVPSYQQPEQKLNSAYSSSMAHIYETDSEWIEQFDSKGTKYWYNKRTGKSRWTKPEEFKTEDEKGDPLIMWKEF